MKKSNQSKRGDCTDGTIYYNKEIDFEQELLDSDHQSHSKISSSANGSCKQI
jgi:hypothetical protein